VGRRPSSAQSSGVTPDEKDAVPRAEAKKEAARKREEDARRKGRRTKIAAIVIGGGFIPLAIALRIFVFEAFEIEGPSMEPELANGDRIVVGKYAYGVFLPFTDGAVVSWGSPEPGDVVIVKSPRDDIDLAKRVIAVGGQSVEIREDDVLVDGSPIRTGNTTVTGEEQCFEERLGRQTYWTMRYEFSPPSNQPPTLVPPGHMYILGDRRDRSNDSRFFGTVAVERVKGVYLFHYVSADPRPACP